MKTSAQAMALAALLLSACSGSTTTSMTSPDAGSGACVSARDCASLTECTSPKICVCSNNACIPTCSTNADCSGGQICIEAICTAAGCGGNSDCSSGQACIGGACTAPIAASQVHACVISPDNADVQAASTVQLTAVAQDASGNALPFSGTTWTITGAATIDASTGLVTATAPTGSVQTGTATATMGSVTCSAPVNVYSTVSAGLRVVVIDQDTKAPLPGAYVVLGSDTAGALQTGADGSVTFTGATGTSHNVHAFAANHDYASYIGITSSDLLIPLRQFYPIANRSPFDGTVTADQLSQLDIVGDDVHVAFYGSGISGSLLDFNFDNLLGAQRDVAIKISTESFNLPNAPGGFVVGLDDQLFTSTATTAPGWETTGYTMYADPGERILWGIGGNLDLATLVTLLTPLAGGGSIDVGTLLPQVLPLLGHLEVGDVVGVEAGASVASGAATPKNLSVALDTPMHMNVALKSPALPKFNGAYLDGAIAVTGAAAFPLGFTPLGLTAGLAATDSNGMKTGAILDPTCTVSASNSCATNTLPLSMATRNHGLESFPYGVGLVALNFSAIGSAGATIALAGKYATEENIAFAGGSSAPTVIDLSATPYMNLPASTGSVSYSLGSRTLTVASDADASTQIYKFTLSAASHQTWSVYLPPAGASAEAAVLVNPADVSPSLVDIQATASSTAYIAAIATTSASNSYASLTGFGNVTVDALGNNLSAFAVQTITLSP